MTLTLLTSCFGGKSAATSSRGGEVVGVGGGRSFKEPAPYGMTLIKRGSLKWVLTSKTVFGEKKLL